MRQPTPQEAATAAREAAQAARQAARDAARDAAQQARAARARGADVQTGDGTRITTSPDGHVTTITGPDGERTVIRTNDDGGVTINTNGNEAVLPAGMPWGEAIRHLVSHQGEAVSFPEPPRNEVPREVFPLVIILMSLIAATIVLFPMSRAMARRMDRKSVPPPAPSPSPEMATRLDRIERAIESMAEEVERVSEAQRYSARLLTERLPETPARAIAADHAR